MPCHPLDPHTTACTLCHRARSYRPLLSRKTPGCGKHSALDGRRALCKATNMEPKEICDRNLRGIWSYERQRRGDRLKCSAGMSAADNFKTKSRRNPFHASFAFEPLPRQHSLQPAASASRHSSGPHRRNRRHDCGLIRCRHCGRGAQSGEPQHRRQPARTKQDFTVSPRSRRVLTK